MSSNFLDISSAANYLGVGRSTLRRWESAEKLIPQRTEGGHRRYLKSDLDKFIGIKENDEEKRSTLVRVATYARCSTSDQKQHGDIDRQSERLTDYCVKHKYYIVSTIKDMGSEINDKRKGFMKLCNLVVKQEIDKVVIEHKDRLTRFQYNLIEFFFKSYGVEIELIDKTEYTEEQELANDMMMLLASFSGRLYSARGKKNIKRRKEQKEKQC